MPEQLPLEALFDALPDAIVWVKPILDETGEPVDFVIAYSNQTADKSINHPKGTLKGLRIRADGVPSAARAEENYLHFLKVFTSGKEDDHAFEATHSGRQLEVTRKPIGGGVLSTTRDREAQRRAEKREKDLQQLFQSIVNASPNGIVVYTAERDATGAIADFRVLHYNQKSNELTGYTDEQRLRRGFRGVLDDFGASDQFHRYVAVVETGVPLFREQYIPAQQRWITSAVVKLNDGFLSLLSDITALKQTQEALRQQSEYANRILNTSLNAVVTMEAVRDEYGRIVDLRYRQVNRQFLSWLSMKEEQVVGSTMLELFPATRTTGIFDVYCQVIEKGEATWIEVPYWYGERQVWYDLSVARLDENAAVGVFNDITENKEAAARVEQHRNLLDNILQHSSNGISVTRMIRNEEGIPVDGQTILANEAAVAHTGIPRELFLSKRATEIDPNLINSPYYRLCLQTLETGISQHTQYHIEPTGRWLEITISRMDAEHLITIFTDVTSTREAQLSLEHSARQLQTIIDRTQSGIFTLQPVKDEAGAVTDFRFGLANRALAAYVHQEPEKLIGRLGSEWFSGYKTNGLFDLYLDTYRNGTVNRFDFHYNADGIDAFIDMQCTRFQNEVLVTFTDYTPVKKLQLQLQSLVEELRRSNTNLEEFAYAASHDLKEPIRKVHFFADRLKEKLADRLQEEDRRLFGRMELATRRMGSLIDDLLVYSQVSLRPRQLEEVNLNGVVELVLGDLELEIEEKGARLEIAPLPTIAGHQRQLQQLFHNLLGNALKYSKPGVPPVIRVSSQILDSRELENLLPADAVRHSYHCIRVQDEGIGFEQAEAERIFNVFTRLHGNSEYRGTGVGLSIARKVAENHQGFLTASGEPGRGATFRLLLPVREEDDGHALGAPQQG
jgi:signal transduction histidine kinase